MIQSQCSLTFNFGDVLENLPQGYDFNIPNRKVVKVFNISSSSPTTSALLNLTLNASEFDWPMQNITIYVEKSKTEWTPIIGSDKVSLEATGNKLYNYVFEAPHFSLFLITEPYYCGNNVFEPAYNEQCDGSAHCTECACDNGYEPDANGNCTETLTETTCFVEGNQSCLGYNLYECGSDLKWDNKGKVAGNCSVECSPIGYSSCQGQVPLKCGTDYQWIFQQKINGLCGYVSGTNLVYNQTGGDELIYCGNGSCGYNEDEYNCPEDCLEKKTNNKNWMIPVIVAAITLLILAIIIVLFKIYKKEKRRPLPGSNRNIPPAHRPGPKRPPGRPQLVHHGQMGRPPERKVSPGGYAIRRYPQRQV